MKRVKIKWSNVIKLILFVFCVYMILHDLYMITIHSYIAGNMYRWTWLGFVTFISFIIVASEIYDDFEEQIKSIPSNQPKHAKDTIRK